MTVKGIAIGVMVLVIPIGAASTTNAAIRTRRCRHRVWAPVGGVIVDNDAVMVDAPVAPLLLPSDATDPMAGVRRLQQRDAHN